MCSSHTVSNAIGSTGRGIIDKAKPVIGGGIVGGPIGQAYGGLSQNPGGRRVIGGGLGALTGGLLMGPIGVGIGAGQGSGVIRAGGGGGRVNGDSTFGNIIGSDPNMSGDQKAIEDELIRQGKLSGAYSGRVNQLYNDQYGQINNLLNQSFNDRSNALNSGMNTAFNEQQQRLDPLNANYASQVNNLYGDQANQLRNMLQQNRDATMQGLNTGSENTFNQAQGTLNNLNQGYYDQANQLYGDQANQLRDIYGQSRTQTMNDLNNANRLALESARNSDTTLNQNYLNQTKALYADQQAQLQKLLDQRRQQAMTDLTTGPGGEEFRRNYNRLGLLNSGAFNQGLSDQFARLQGQESNALLEQGINQTNTLQGILGQGYGNQSNIGMAGLNRNFGAADLQAQLQNQQANALANQSQNRVNVLGDIRGQGYQANANLAGQRANRQLGNSDFLAQMMQNDTNTLANQANNRVNAMNALYGQQYGSNMDLANQRLQGRLGALTLQDQLRGQQAEALLNQGNARVGALAGIEGQRFGVESGLGIGGLQRRFGVADLDKQLALQQAIARQRQDQEQAAGIGGALGAIGGGILGAGGGPLGMLAGGSLGGSIGSGLGGVFRGLF